MSQSQNYPKNKPASGAKSTSVPDTKTASAPESLPSPSSVKPASQADALPAAGASLAPANKNQFLNVTTQHIEKVSFNMIKNYDEFASINKETVDVLVKSGTIWSKGVEEISRHVLALAQSSVETGIATSKAAMGAKTLKELLEVQSDWVRSTFDNAITEATKLSEISVKVANQAAEPVQTHITNAFNRISTKQAA